MAEDGNDGNQFPIEDVSLEPLITEASNAG